MVLADMWWIFLLSFGVLGMSEKNYKIFGSVLGTLNLSNFFGSPGAFPFVYIRIFFYLFLIKPFLLFFFGLNLILNQFMIIYDSCVHAPPTTSDVFFQVRGMALFSLLLVCCCCCWFFFFPSLYLGNGSEQTNIVIYGAHWFIFVVSKLLFLGSIGVNTTKLDADKFDRHIYLGKVVWVIAVAPLAPYREVIIILVNMPFILSTTGESGIYFLEFGCRISYMAHESLTFR